MPRHKMSGSKGRGEEHLPGNLQFGGCSTGKAKQSLHEDSGQGLVAVLRGQGLMFGLGLKLTELEGERRVEILRKMLLPNTIVGFFLEG